MVGADDAHGPLTVGLSVGCTLAAGYGDTSAGQMTSSMPARAWFIGGSLVFTDTGGRRVGLGDWRPEKIGHYGRFDVQEVDRAAGRCLSAASGR